MDDISRKAARVMEEAAARSERMTPEEIISEYDKIEITLLSNSLDCPEYFTEIRRRIAEWKFYLLSERDLPFDIIDKLYGNLQELGFENLARKANVGILFGKYLISKNRRDSARVLLREISDELTIFLANDDFGLYRSFQNIHSALINCA